MSNPSEWKKPTKPASLLGSNPVTLPSENLRFIAPTDSQPQQTSPETNLNSAIASDSFDLQQYYENLRMTANCVQSLVNPNAQPETSFNVQWNNQPSAANYSNLTWSNQSYSNNNAGSPNYLNSPTQSSNNSNMTSPVQEQTPTSSPPASTVPNPNIPNFLTELQPHWFYRVNDKKSTNKPKSADASTSTATNSNELENECWLPFNWYDSNNLESAYQSNSKQVVSTNGGRYDCDVTNRTCSSIYWSEDSFAIRRGTWFYKKEGYVRFVPYPESLASELESICEDVIKNNRWNQRIELSNRSQGCLVFYNLNAIMHYDSIDDVIKDDSNLVVGNPHNPRIVRRSLNQDDLRLYEEVNLDEGESDPVDHLVFLVHGIGEFCDMRFRTIREVVDDFRRISLQLVNEHFKSNSTGSQPVGRVEFIPIYWHGAVRGQETGNDRQLRLITLPSIPKLRNFTNDTILDALFYTSPVYCQMILDTVARELNRLYSLFLARNPSFSGSVAVSGHSLGSLILFDILANQPDPKDQEKPNLTNLKDNLPNTSSMNQIASPTGQPLVNYPMICFKPSCFFALGSPISMFLTIRGVKHLSLDFRLPTCRKMYNLYHPFDPIAYRIEPLLNSDYAELPAVTLPHHKGRKRMHLQIKENLLKVSTDIKEKVLFGIRQTWNSVNSIVRLGTNLPVEALPASSAPACPDTQSTATQAPFNRNRLVSGCEDELEDEDNLQSKIDPKYPIGQLNSGERIDFVLQEKPIEYFNEYIFALATHACYWQSEDTCLFILKELYKLNGIQPGPIRSSQSFTYNPFGAIPVINQLGYSSLVQSAANPQTSKTSAASSSSSTNRTSPSKSQTSSNDAIIQF